MKMKMIQHKSAIKENNAVKNRFGKKRTFTVNVVLVRRGQSKSGLKQWNGKWQAQFLISKVSFPLLMVM